MIKKLTQYGNNYSLAKDGKKHGRFKAAVDKSFKKFPRMYKKLAGG